MLRKASTRKNDKNDSSKRKMREEEDVVKKRSRFLEGIIDVDINDFEFLRKFVTEHGKIIPARLSGANSKQQRQIKKGVRRARVMGLLQ